MQKLDIDENILYIGLVRAVAIWDGDIPNIFVAIRAMHSDNIPVYMDMYLEWCKLNQCVQLLSVAPVWASYSVSTPQCGIAMLVHERTIYIHRACIEILHSSGVVMDMDADELKKVLYWIEDTEFRLMSKEYHRPFSKQLSLLEVEAAEKIVERKEVARVEYPLEGLEKEVSINFMRKTLAITTLLNILNKAGLDTRTKGMTQFNQALDKAGLHIDNGSLGHKLTKKGQAVGMQVYLNENSKWYSSFEKQAIPFIQEVWENEGLMTRDGITYKMIAK